MDRMMLLQRRVGEWAPGERMWCDDGPWSVSGVTDSGKGGGMGSSEMELELDL